MSNQTNKTRKMVTVAMLSAVSSVLMFFSFNVPLMPSFIKMDFSELPALIAAYSWGPGAGVAVCFIKNLMNLFFTTTGGVGELSNFILGCLFVFPAGLIYQKNKTKKGALAGAVAGAVVMAAVSVVTNYFIVYPAYTLFLPMEAILRLYQAIYPKIDGLLQALLIFNMPYTFFKGMANAAIAMMIYKPLSPVLKGRK